MTSSSRSEPRLLFISGSAREKSWNKKLAKLGEKIADANGIAGTFADLGDYPMPIYNGDDELRGGPPENTRKLVPLARIARCGAASPLGTGRQQMPWVHIEDLVRAYRQAVDDERMQGAFNVAASNVMNKELMRLLAMILHRPFILPAVPGWAMKSLLGDLATVLLEGSRVANGKLIATGFRFEHTSLEAALRALLGK